MAVNSDTFYQGINTVVNKAVSNLSFNKTVCAVITDNSESDKGYYSVDEGTATYTAYSKEKYENGDTVYIIIPNGDYNEEKTILRKKTDEDSEAFYQDPKDNIAFLGNNLFQNRVKESKKYIFQDIPLALQIGKNANTNISSATKIFDVDKNALTYFGLSQRDFRTNKFDRLYFSCDLEASSNLLYGEFKIVVKFNDTDDYTFELPSSQMTGSIFDSCGVAQKQEVCWALDFLELLRKTQVKKEKEAADAEVESLTALDYETGLPIKKSENNKYELDEFILNSVTVEIIYNTDENATILNDGEDSANIAIQLSNIQIYLGVDPNKIDDVYTEIYFINSKGEEIVVSELNNTDFHEKINSFQSIQAEILYKDADNHKLVRANSSNPSVIAEECGKDLKLIWYKTDPAATIDSSDETGEAGWRRINIEDTLNQFKFDLTIEDADKDVGAIRVRVRPYIDDVPVNSFSNNLSILNGGHTVAAIPAVISEGLNIKDSDSRNGIWFIYQQNNSALPEAASSATRYLEPYYNDMHLLDYLAQNMEIGQVATISWAMLGTSAEVRGYQDLYKDENAKSENSNLLKICGNQGLIIRGNQEFVLRLTKKNNIVYSQSSDTSLLYDVFKIETWQNISAVDSDKMGFAEFNWELSEGEKPTDQAIKEKIRLLYSIASRMPGIKDSFIKLNYTLSKAKNKSEAVKEFRFGRFGTNGTEYNFLICPEDGRPPVVVSGAEEADWLTIYPKLYDKMGVDISDQITSISWSWYEGGVNYKYLKLITDDLNKYCKIRTFTQAEANADPTEKTKVFADDDQRSIYILQGQIIINGIKVNNYLPIAITNVPFDYLSSYFLNGTTEIFYDSAGKLITGTTDIIPYSLATSRNDFSVKIYPSGDPVNNIFDFDLNATKKMLKPPLMYSKQGVCVHATWTNSKGVSRFWSQPILIMQNTNPSTLVNNWDGQLTLDNANNTIMAASMIAGIKENNKFTGVMIGKVQGDAEGSLTKNSGIFGFKEGSWSYAFKDDGTAFIGGPGAGRLYFDGTSGVIKSASISDANYTVSDSIKTLNDYNAAWKDNYNKFLNKLDTENKMGGAYFDIQHGVLFLSNSLYATGADIKGKIHATSLTLDDNARNDLSTLLDLNQYAHSSDVPTEIAIKKSALSAVYGVTITDANYNDFVGKALDEGDIIEHYGNPNLLQNTDNPISSEFLVHRSGTNISKDNKISVNNGSANDLNIPYDSCFVCAAHTSEAEAINRSYLYTQKISVIGGKKYTFSFKYRFEGTTAQTLSFYWRETRTTTTGETTDKTAFTKTINKVDNEWHDYNYTFTTDSAAIKGYWRFELISSNTNNNVRINYIKLEKGSKFTPYTRYGINAVNLYKGNLTISKPKYVDLDGNTTTNSDLATQTEYVTVSDGSKSWDIGTKGLLVSSNAVIKGTIIATHGIFSGSLEAPTGKLGGFSITNTTNNTVNSAKGGHCYANSLMAQTSTTEYDYEAGIKGSNSTSSDLAFYVKRVNSGKPWNDNSVTTVFRVNHAGGLYAADATITGKITATSGQIGQWVVAPNSGNVPNSLYGETSIGSERANIILAPNGTVANKYYVINSTAETNKWSVLVGRASSGDQFTFGIDVKGNVYARSLTLTSNFKIGTGNIDGLGALAKLNTITFSKDFITGAFSRGTPTQTYGTENVGFKVDANGNMIASNALFYGKIYTNGGRIGNWVFDKDAKLDTSAKGGHIYANSLYGHSADSTYEYEVGMKTTQSNSDSASNLAFYVGQLKKGQKWTSAAGENFQWNFYIRNNGQLYARNAEIHGTIYATTLKLGSAARNFTGSYNDLTDQPTIPDVSKINLYFKDGKLCKGTVDKTYETSSKGFSVNSDGLLEASNAAIYGQIYASGGRIGNWTITDSKNSSGVPNGLVYDSGGYQGIFCPSGTTKTWFPYGYPTVTTNLVLLLGRVSGANSFNFAVTKAGKLYANGATISGKITATEGKIAGFNIGIPYSGTKQLSASSVLNIAFKNKGLQYTTSAYIAQGKTTTINTYKTYDYTDARMTSAGIEAEWDYYNSASIHIDNDILGNLLTTGFNTVKIGGKRTVASAGTTVETYLLETNNYFYKGTLNGTWLLNNSSISTSSDIKRKNSISLLSIQYSEFFDKLNPVIYKYNDGASNRFHVGFIAQDVQSALISSNISTQNFAGLVIENLDSENEEEKNYYLRYEEFIALNTHEIQNLKKKVNQQQEEIDELKNQIQELRQLILGGNGE